MNRPGQPRPGPPPGFGLPGGVGGSGVPRGIGQTPPGVNVYGNYGLQGQQQASSQPQRAGSLPHPSSGGGFAGVGRGGIVGGGVLGGQGTNYLQQHQSAAQAQAQAQAQRAGSLGFSNPSSVLHTPSSLQNAHAHQQAHQQQTQQQQQQISNTHALAQAHQQQQNQNQSLVPPPSQTPSAHSQGSHTSPLPPHLSSSLSPGGESTGAGGFDPSDFPALGTSAPHAPSSVGSGAAPVSYAQAGGVSSNGLTGTGGANAGPGPTRAFTPDDFPALGGGGGSGQGQDHGPNGLDGQSQSQTPGLLNLGQAHARAQTMDNDKRNGPTSSSQPWSSSTNGSYSQLSGASPGPTGTTITGSSRDTPASSTLAATPLHGPIGIGGGGPPGIAGAMGGMNSGMGPGVGGIPQTAAAQIFASAADKWGLLGLIAALRSPDPERALLAQGSDLRGMGLDLAASGATVLGARFAGPWAHSNGSANGEAGRGEVEPDYVLPVHYSVHPPPPGPAKALLFGEETLFLVFYENPRDALQEVAAQELYTRGWRWHKTQQLWLSKDGQPQPSQKIAGGAGEAGTYVCWDAVNWGRELRDLTVMYSDLEERAPSGVFPNTVSLTYPGQGQGPAGQGAGQQGQQGQQREALNQGPPGVGLQGPGRFGGGIAAM